MFRRTSLFSRTAYAWYGLGILVVIFTVIAFRVPSVQRFVELLPCRMTPAGSSREECVFDAIQQVMIASDTGEALELFAAALPLITSESSKHCHGLAHRVGDIAYYRVYVAGSEKLRINDSFATTICDYGFYHGFYEHLFQANSNMPFMQRTCDSLPTGPEKHKEIIRNACFHAIGHGLVLAQGDVLPRKDWGNMRAFADGPLSVCEELTGSAKDERHRCQSGIFAEIRSWGITDDYGFSLPQNQRERYDDCLVYGNPSRGECISPTALASVLKFGIEDTLASCSLIGDTMMFAPCIKGMINALFASPPTGSSLREGAALCRHDIVAARDGSTGCFEQLAWALSAYFPESERGQYCSLFPESLQSRGCVVR